MAFRISVDTGGTFTDVVVADEAGRIVIGKALTTSERIFLGMKAAIDVAAEQIGIGPAELLARTEVLIYGTTRAINAVITQRTAKTAFLTTRGFPDVLVFKEGGKSNPSDFTQDFPQPYIPRRHTFEIDERIAADGSVFAPLDRDQVGSVLLQLQRRKFEAVAVSFIWSIANPAHELAVGELIESMLPGVPYTLSHRLIPILREYRRASATAIDASLKPLMQRHLRDMQDDLREAGYGGELLISTSVGGCMHVAEVVERPIHMLKSGPAMAPVAGAAYAAAESLPNNIIVCDTGGTTFDVGLVRDGGLVYTRDSWLGPRWVGNLIAMSTVDVRSVGAGGGSIAWIDDGGLLRVGPQSAGSSPGPACYGRGGAEPTVTDAAVVLGYIDPRYFVGGRLPLDADAARSAVGALAGRLGRSVEATAFAVVQVANELMIKAISEITISEGLDPGESILVAGGGAAGLNILPIARELGCATVLIPRTASVLSACGMQVSDIIAEQSGSRLTNAESFDTAGVNGVLDAIAAELDRFVAALPKVPSSRIQVDFFVEARYRAQVWELETPMPVSRVRGPADVAALAEAFHRAHERVYAVRDPGSVVEFVNWKGRVSVAIAPPLAKAAAVPRQAAPAPARSRQAFFGDAGSILTPVHRGGELPRGAWVNGPAIIEEETTTIVVYPGTAVDVSGSNHFIARIA